jgi:superkiller protein 3
MNKDNGKFIRENHSAEYGDSDAWCDRGIALLNLERYEEALQASEKALELSPNHSGAWCLKGIAFDKLGRYEEALQAYDKALELYPDYVDAWIFKLDVLCKLGRDEEAQWLEKEFS